MIFTATPFTANAKPFITNYHEIDDQAICDDLGVQKLVCLWNKAINPKRPVAYGLLDWQYIRNQ